MTSMTKEFPEIERRRGLTPEEFRREYVQANKPVVLEGIADYWKERWTPELFKAQYGDQVVFCETNELFTHEKKRLKLELSKVVDSAVSGSLEYRIRSGAFLSKIPGLQQEFEEHKEFRSFLPPNELKHQFWLAPAGNVTLLHHDTFYENLNVQVYGRKHFVMLPPKDFKRMYYHFFAESPIDPRHPDLSKFPKYAGAQPVETVLEPGDTLYIPQFWWHFVTALDLTVNINTWAKADRSSAHAITASFPLMPKIVYRVLQNQKFEYLIDSNVKRVYSLYLWATGRKPAAASS